jgi:hypothetical protein
LLLSHDPIFDQLFGPFFLSRSLPPAPCYLFFKLQKALVSTLYLPEHVGDAEFELVGPG